MLDNSRCCGTCTLWKWEEYAQFLPAFYGYCNLWVGVNGSIVVLCCGDPDFEYRPLATFYSFYCKLYEPDDTCQHTRSLEMHIYDVDNFEKEKGLLEDVVQRIRDKYDTPRRPWVINGKEPNGKQDA